MSQHSGRSAANSSNLGNSSTNPIAAAVTMTPVTTAESSRRKKMSMTYATDADGRPVGLPLDLFLFSSGIKQTQPKQKDPIHEFSDKNRLPETKMFPNYEWGKMAGNFPLTADFHKESNRERTGPTDDGLDDEDLTYADGVVRKKKQVVVKRKSIIYDNIWVYKGEFIFPYRTYRPKVQVPYKGGKVPQAVVTERLHRLYKRTDINLVLQQLGIEVSDLIPPPNYAESNERFFQEMTFRNRIRVNGVFKKDYILHGGKVERKADKMHSHMHLHAPKDQSTLSYPSSSSEETEEYDSGDTTLFGDESQLEAHLKSHNEEIHPFIKSKPPFGFMFPLRCFDNTEFDIRSPKDWIGLGWDTKERKFFPLPGKAFLPLPGNPVKKKSQALSETVVDHLLESSPRLLKMYQWLLKERFQRTVKMFGIDPDKLKYAPTEMEMSLLARMGSTVPALFRVSSTTLGNLKSARYSKDKDLEEFSLMELMDMHEMLGEKSTDSISNTQNPKLDIDGGGQVIQLKNIVYKKRVERKADSDDSSDDEDEATVPRTKKLSQSQKDDATVAPETLVTEVEEVDEAEVTEAEVEIDDDTESKDWTGTGPEPSHAYVHTDYGPPRPISPDVDSLIEGHDKYVLDFDKMKKVHVHEWKWVDVAIFDYNETTQKFYVRTIYPPLVHAWVDKIYLCFDGEDPNIQGKRIRDAVVRRIETENIMRFNLYVDCLPVDDFPSVPPQKTMDVIVRKTLSTPKIRFTEKALDKVKKEIQLEYRRVLAKAKFIQVVDRHHHLYKPWVSVPDNEREPANLDHHNEHRKLAEIRGEIPMQSFEYKKKRLKRESVKFNEREPADALMRIHEICLEAKTRSLIITDFEPLHLDEWQKKQLENISEVRQYLKFEWSQMIVDCINEHLGKIPRSWYNLKETNYDVFVMSKLSKYLELVKTMMEDTLRSIVTESLQRYIDRVKEVTMAIDYSRQFSWAGGDLITSLYPTPKYTQEIWILEMFMDAECPKYSQRLVNFAQSSQKIFTEVIKAVKDLPTLLPQVMPQMNFATRSFLNSPSESELGFQKMLSEMKKYIKRSLLAVDSYVQLYKRYLDIWNVDALLEQWESKKHTADEVIEELDKHTKHAEQLEKEIPLDISISGYKIVSSVVRDGLLKKKRQMYTTILDNFALRLKLEIMRVRDDYAEIEKKLNTRSDDIGEVMELKAYLLTVPGLVATLEEVTRGVIKDYGVFDRFMVSIPDEDVNAKWQTGLSSGRILKMCKAAHKWLEEDYDRVLYVQQGDLAALSDQVDSVSMSVAGLIGFMDLQKASEVSQKVNTLWKTVRELQEQCALLNTRQKIFGYPPALQTPIEKLVEDIEPYRSLWSIAADWLKVQDSVFNQSLEKVDIDALAKVVSEGAEVIDTLIEYFEEVDQIQIMAQNIKFQIEEFQPLVPMISTLKNDGMRQRHWEAICELTGIDAVGISQNFKELQGQGIQNFATEITQIGEYATKEAAIENTLDKMLHGIVIHKVQLVVEPYSKQNIISVTDGAMEMVEGYIKITNEIKENQFKGPFEERLSIWDKKINSAKTNLELWFQNQGNWLDLEQQFRAPDVQIRLPVEYKMFEKLQRIWKRLVRLAKNNTSLIELPSDPTVFSSIHQFDELVVKIRKALEEHQQPKNSDEEDD